MIKWREVTWYSQIAAIIVGIAIFILGIRLGALAFQEPNISPDSGGTESIETFIASSELRLTFETSTYAESRNFVFMNAEGKTVTTFSVHNNGLEAPSYFLVNGPDRDWLVIRKLGMWGSSLITYEDEWYIFDGQRFTKALAYTSYQDITPPYPDGPFTYLRTEIDSSDLPNKVTVTFTTKSCEDGAVQENCLDEVETKSYFWDQEVRHFIGE